MLYISNKYFQLNKLTKDIRNDLDKLEKGEVSDFSLMLNHPFFKDSPEEFAVVVKKILYPAIENKYHKSQKSEIEASQKDLQKKIEKILGTASSSYKQVIAFSEDLEGAFKDNGLQKELKYSGKRFYGEKVKKRKSKEFDEKIKSVKSALNNFNNKLEELLKDKYPDLLSKPETLALIINDFMLENAKYNVSKMFPKESLGKKQSEDVDSIISGIKDKVKSKLSDENKKVFEEALNKYQALEVSDEEKTEVKYVANGVYYKGFSEDLLENFNFESKLKVKQVIDNIFKHNGILDDIAKKEDIAGKLEALDEELIGFLKDNFANHPEQLGYIMDNFVYEKFRKALDRKDKDEDEDKTLYKYKKLVIEKLIDVPNKIFGENATKLHDAYRSEFKDHGFQSNKFDNEFTKEEWMPWLRENFEGGMSSVFSEGNHEKFASFGSGLKSLGSLGSYIASFFSNKGIEDAVKDIVRKNGVLNVLKGEHNDISALNKGIKGFKRAIQQKKSKEQIDKEIQKIKKALHINNKTDKGFANNIDEIIKDVQENSNLTKAVEELQNAIKNNASKLKISEKKEAIYKALHLNFKDTAESTQFRKVKKVIDDNVKNNKFKEAVAEYKKAIKNNASKLKISEKKEEIYKALNLNVKDTKEGAFIKEVIANINSDDTSKELGELLEKMKERKISFEKDEIKKEIYEAVGLKVLDSPKNDLIKKVVEDLEDVRENKVLHRMLIGIKEGVKGVNKVSVVQLEKKKQALYKELNIDNEDGSEIREIIDELIKEKNVNNLASSTLAKMNKNLHLETEVAEEEKGVKEVIDKMLKSLDFENSNFTEQFTNQLNSELQKLNLDVVLTQEGHSIAKIIDDVLESSKNNLDDIEKTITNKILEESSFDFKVVSGDKLAKMIDSAINNPEQLEKLGEELQKEYVNYFQDALKKEYIAAKLEDLVFKLSNAFKGKGYLSTDVAKMMESLVYEKIEGELTDEDSKKYGELIEKELFKVGYNLYSEYKQHEDLYSYFHSFSKPYVPNSKEKELMDIVDEVCTIEGCSEPQSKTTIALEWGKWSAGKAANIGGKIFFGVGVSVLGIGKWGVGKVGDTYNWFKNDSTSFYNLAKNHPGEAAKKAVMGTLDSIINSKPVGVFKNLMYSSIEWGTSFFGGKSEDKEGFGEEKSNDAPEDNSDSNEDNSIELRKLKDSYDNFQKEESEEFEIHKLVDFDELIGDFDEPSQGDNNSGASEGEGSIPTEEPEMSGNNECKDTMSDEALFFGCGEVPDEYYNTDNTDDGAGGDV